MSLRAQIAFGKNFTLQKQLEDEFLNIRRMFKNSRRRMDTMEEECVAALYKLLLYAREKQGLTEKGGVDFIDNLFRKSRSASVKRSQSAFEIFKAGDNSQVTRRPDTAMSANTYTQSYSFTKDGLNIGKTRHDRFMRTKAEKERQKENNIKIERMKDDWKSLDRPMTAIERMGTAADDDEEENEALPKRPKTVCSLMNHKGLLSRPRMRKTLMLPQETLTTGHRSSTPVTVTGSEIQNTLADTHLDGLETRSSVRERRLEYPCLKTVHENQTRLDGTKSPLIVRITTTRPNDSADYEIISEKAIHSRAESRLDNTVEEELISLNEDNKNNFNELVNTAHNDEIRRRTPNYKPATARFLATSRNASTPNNTLDGSILRKSAEKTQSFLTQYSKKSKVIGYVMKTRSSAVAPRERLVSQRSPCITYQELTSIKASLRQHESRTRSLVQRSAKLSTYVDKLARAGEVRKRRQEIKEHGNE